MRRMRRTGTLRVVDVSRSDGRRGGNDARAWREEVGGEVDTNADMPVPSARLRLGDWDNPFIDEDARPRQDSLSARHGEQAIQDGWAVGV